MDFEIIHHEKENFIESILLADFNWNVMSKMVPALSEIINEKKTTRILLDWRKGKITLSITEMYDTPERLRTEFQKYGVNIFQLKRAFLINTIDRESYFFETVMKNNSQIFTIFTDRQKAIEWLNK